MDNIEALLKEKGLTKTAFSDLLGIKKQNLNGLMKNPTLETLERIANALEVDIAELFVRNTPDSEVNGYVKVKGTLYEVHSFEDLRKLSELNV